jgi:hypothetical protein
MSPETKPTAEENAIRYQEKKNRGDFQPLRKPLPEDLENAERWQQELEALERPAPTYITVPLLGGRTIRIKSLLNKTEAREFGRLQRESAWATERVQKRLKNHKHPDPKDLDTLDEIALKIIALVVDNPEITEEYLRERDEQGTLVRQDLAAIINAAYNTQLQQIKEVVAAASFRGELGGAGIRGDAHGMAPPSP